MSALLAAIPMQPGRGDGVVAYGAHYGDQMLAAMRVSGSAELVAANLRGGKA